ncbi:WD40-repeat-containing domain protein [Cubamyces lactineus]|nr:WD40-repeat-containing domain protein [Cubamyces lactineus]
MHRRRASPTSSTSPLSLPTTGTRPITTTGDSRGKDSPKTCLSLLISALKITKEVSSACPQLQLAVGALLTVLEAYKRYSETTEAIETLLSRIQPLNEILKKIQSDGDCPQALKDRLAALASKVTEVVKAAKEVQSKRWILQLMNSVNYTEKAQSWIKMLDWHIRSFVRGFKAMNARFDQVIEGITVVKEGINELNVTPLHKALRPVIEALLYNKSNVHVQCYENTRTEVLETLSSWLQPRHPPFSNQPILWLYALAGSGKSTIALTIADQWMRDDLLGASFFCARDGQRSDVNCIFRTIAYQLALRFPEFQEQLTKILKMDPDLHSTNPTRQLEKLIVAPLQAVHANTTNETPFPANVAVVIDALDECTDNNAVSIILKSLALYIGQLAPLKFLITSRPEENITRGFLLQSLDENTHRFALNKIPEDLTKRDISLFLRSRLATIGNGFDLGASWPAPERIENLVGLSEHLFIFAALAARHIENPAERDPDGRLRSLLDAGNAAAAKRGISTSAFPILDALYIQVLETAAKKLGDTLKAQLKLVLGTIVLAEQRLSPGTLDALLDLPTGTVRRVLPVFGAILTIPDREDDTTPIGIIHLSFPNFLVDPDRCTDQSFLVTPRIHHSYVAFRCLNMMKVLKYNILEVVSKHDRVLNSEIPNLSTRLSQRIPAPLEYACRYWTRHLCEAEIGEDLLTALEEFCTSHLLHWLEVLSLLGSLQSAQTCLKAQSLRATDAPSLLYDCERAVRAFHPIVSTSAMHMYSNIAIFVPLDTPIQGLAAVHARTSLEVRVGLENTWSDTLVSCVMDESSLAVLAFSPDGIYVACGQWGGTIRLFNAHTGAAVQVFGGYAVMSIQCLSFSPTGKELLSGIDKGVVDLWDVETGAKLNTWKTHSRFVGSVAWSPDGTLAASASSDNTVRLWRVASPETMVVLQHDGLVFHIVYAPDGDLLSGSWDETCKIWDTRCADWDTETDVKPTRTLQHGSLVTTVAVSSDSCLVACSLYNGKIVLWTKSDGQRLRSLPGQSQVISLAVYPSGLLAAAYKGSPFMLWDVSTGALVKSADNEGATAAAFASDGVHIAHDTNKQLHVRLWPVEVKQNMTRATGITAKLKQLSRGLSVDDHKPVGNCRTDLRAATTSPTGKLVLAVYYDELRMYEVSTGRRMRTIDHYSSDFPSAAWSSTGRLFACAARDHAVHVWQAENGEHVRTLTGHSGRVTRILFTCDEQHVLSASDDGTIRRDKIEVQTSSEVLFQSVGDWIWCLAILSSSRRNDSPPDTPSADLLAHPSRQPVKSEYGFYYALRLHDVTTGNVVWIEYHQHRITSVAFSEDCTRALAGNNEGEVFLYDLTQIIPLRSPPPTAVPEHKLTVRGTDRYIPRISFSSDGRVVITDRTYTSIPSELQPLHTAYTDRSLTAISFYEGDWLWRINHPDSDPRRLCWIPPIFRPHKNSVEPFLSASGQFIVYFTLGGSLIVMDGASIC